MLLPQYKNLQNFGKSQRREGCWFCPNAKLCEHKAIKEKMPEAWARYVALEDTPRIAYQRWNPYTGETLHQRDEILTYGIKQYSLFEFIRLPGAKSTDDEKRMVQKRCKGQLSLFDVLKAG